MTQPYKLDTAAVEKEHNMSGPGNGKSDWFEIKEGANRMRLLTPHAILVSHFSQNGYKGTCVGKDNNCPGCKRDAELKAQKDALLAQKDEEGAKKIRLTRNLKYLYWVIDREDGMFKLFKMPHTVAKMLQALQEDPEYTFSDMPMPYDITINAEGAGKQTVKYVITPARNNTALTTEEEKALGTLTSTEDIVEKMKDKKKKELGVDVGSADHDRAAADSTSIEHPTEDINPDDIPF